MKNGGRIPWSYTAICETFKISCLMGRHPMNGGSEYHLTDQLSSLEQWSNITLFLQRPIETTPKVLPGIFVGYVLHAKGIWKGDVIVADIEELEHMDASELHAVKTSYPQSQMQQSRLLEEIRS